MIRSLSQRSRLQVYPVAMPTRHLLTLVSTAMLLILLGCELGGEGQTEGANISTELKAIVSTDRGEFTILLRPDLTPVAVANFVNLAERGFYHGAEVANANRASFSVGNTKYKTSNYTILPEYATELLFDRPGIVAWTFMDDPEMVKNFVPHPTRFFVTKSAQSNWNLTYASFGEVVDGIDVVEATQKGDWIKSIRIIGDTKAALAPHADKIKTWNTAIDDAKKPVMQNEQKGIKLPKGAEPAGF